MEGILNWMAAHPLIVIIILLVLFIVFTYNNLNAKKQRVEKSFSTIDVYLEKRFDEVSALIEQTMNSYEHESKTYIELSRARSGIIEAKNGSINDKISAANSISAILANPAIKTEAYPELDAIRTMGIFTAKKTSSNEEQLASARRQYNNNATSYNTKIKSFPTVIIASMFGFNKAFDLFKADEAKRKAPNEDARIERMNLETAKIKGEAEVQQINQEAALLEAKANLARQQQAYAETTKNLGDANFSEIENKINDNDNINQNNNN